MQIFLTRKIDNSAELCAQFTLVESGLEGVWRAIADTEKLLRELEKGMQMEKVEARRMEEEKKITEAKCKDGEHERD